jgi:hypothetical protein
LGSLELASASIASVGIQGLAYGIMVWLLYILSSFQSRVVSDLKMFIIIILLYIVYSLRSYIYISKDSFSSSLNNWCIGTYIMDQIHQLFNELTKRIFAYIWNQRE